MDALAAAWDAFAPALASALLHSLWQVALLAVAAALALSAMARASAASRHAVAMAALVAMLLVPAAHCVRTWQRSEALIEAGLLAELVTPRFGGAGPAQDASPLAAAMAALWLSGVGLMLARHVAGLRAIAALERGPSPLLPLRWQRRVDELRGALGIARAVAVRLTDDVLMPCAARWLRPVIWLPLSLVTRAPADQLEALLAHELAHVARKDWLWNGLQCAIEALLFFHPAAWWLGRRIRQEREHACDDLAVAACGDGLALAEALAALERARRDSPRLALAAGGGSLVRRIARLLSGPPSTGRGGALALLGAVSVSGLLLLAQAGLTGFHTPDLHVSASTAGALGPGDWRQIIDNEPDGQRFYRAEVDAEGRLTELYRRDGQLQPIDEAVRHWLDGISRMSLPPHPEAPLDVHPDAQPDIARDVERELDFEALVERIAGHPAVVARLGSPATATSRPVNGNVRVDGNRGDADIRIELRGPRGMAVVAVEARMRDRVWSLQSVDVR